MDDLIKEVKKLKVYEAMLIRRREKGSPQYLNKEEKVQEEEEPSSVIEYRKEENLENF